jgi:hypothetical protein
VASDDDGSDAEATPQKLALQIQPAHIGHFQIGNQTIGHTGGERRQEVASRSKGSAGESASVEQPSDGLTRGGVVVHNRQISGHTPSRERTLSASPPEADVTAGIRRGREGANSRRLRQV